MIRFAYRTIKLRKAMERYRKMNCHLEHSAENSRNHCRWPFPKGIILRQFSTLCRNKQPQLTNKSLYHYYYKQLNYYQCQHCSNKQWMDAEFFCSPISDLLRRALFFSLASLWNLVLLYNRIKFQSVHNGYTCCNRKIRLYFIS